MATFVALVLVVGSSASGADGAEQADRTATETPAGPAVIGVPASSPVLHASLGAAFARSVAEANAEAAIVRRSPLVEPVPANVGLQSHTAATVRAALQIAPAIRSIAASQTGLGTGPLLKNGGFDAGMTDWFTANQADATSTVIVEDAGDRLVEVTTKKTEGSIAQDVPTSVEAGRTYASSIRAVSPSGLPVLVELAVHGLNADGSLAETTNRIVMVEAQEIPITATFTPTSDHASLRIEVYVHTVDRPVRFDNAKLIVDGSHQGPENYGYQQPRVRYLDGVDLAALEPGGHYRIEVSVSTTTDQPWSCCAAVGAVRLGTEDADLVGGSSRPSALHAPASVDGSNWLSPTRVGFDLPASTVGGTFTTIITAPTKSGPFAERFRLVAEGVTWMPGPVIEIIGAVVEASIADETPVTEDDDPAIGDDPADLLTECPPGVSIAKPDPTTSDCVGRISGFDAEISDIGPNRFTVSWVRPPEVSFDFYLIEVQDLDIEDEQERSLAARTLETGDRGIVVEAEPGNYAVRVIALDENGQWVRGDDLTVSVPEPTPIVEIDIPPISCPPAPVTGNGLPVPCVPSPDSPNPSVACKRTDVVFERSMLMRYRGSDLTTVTPIDLSCSEYTIELRSSDPRHSRDYQPDQVDERWYLQGLDASGDVIYTSPTTEDLPPTRTESVLRVGPVDLDGVVAFRGRHLGQGVSPNSITVAATLIPAP